MTRLVSVTLPALSGHGEIMKQRRAFRHFAYVFCEPREKDSEKEKARSDESLLTIKFINVSVFLEKLMRAERLIKKGKKCPPPVGTARRKARVVDSLQHAQL